jgi:methylated-DNA-[protein]-cysteine S-methyltransferase
MESWFYDSPIGALEIRSSGSLIHEILFSSRAKENEDAPRPGVVVQCMQQLDEYFQGKRKDFDFAFSQHGSPFQQKVWSEVISIPYGKIISYLELSRRIGDTKAIRAVGSANGKNNMVIVVPCHRVIGSNGDLVGYGGGLWRKKWLLEHENMHENGVQVLFSHDVKDFGHKR